VDAVSDPTALANNTFANALNWLGAQYQYVKPLRYRVRASGTPIVTTTVFPVAFGFYPINWNTGETNVPVLNSFDDTYI
jgi:hypothetical protein